MRPNHRFRPRSFVLDHPLDVLRHRAIPHLRFEGLPAAQFDVLAQHTRVLARQSPILRAAPPDVVLLPPVEDRQQSLNFLVHGGLLLLRQRVELVLRVRTGQQSQLLFRPLRLGRVHLAQVSQSHFGRAGSRLHVEAVKFDFPGMLGIGVVIPHPFDHRAHLLRVPRPEIDSGQRLLGISPARQHQVIDVEAFGHGGFNGEDVEPHLRDKKLEHPVLELEELTRAVGRFTQRHDAGRTDDRFERLHVREPMPRLDRLQPDRVGGQPASGGFGSSRSGFIRADGRGRSFFLFLLGPAARLARQTDQKQHRQLNWRELLFKATHSFHTPLDSSGRGGSRCI